MTTPPTGRTGTPGHDPEPRCRVRARHTASTVTVYQVYAPEIGLPAIRDGRFPSQWKRGTG